MVWGEITENSQRFYGIFEPAPSGELLIIPREKYQTFVKSGQENWGFPPLDP
jgi:hypothetical protein